MNSRDEIKNKKRWVVKVGSAVLTDHGRGLDIGLIGQLSGQLAQLRSYGIQLILVSSGAVAAGMTQLGMGTRPRRINDLQAAAAVGQASLVRHYEEALKPFEISIAQVLLTHADIANRERYLNAKSTLSRLLELGVLSVVNENDTVATDEICFGDNDSLAALVCNLVEADLLVVLTDQDGLYTADPRSNSAAELLHQVNANDDKLKEMASAGSDLGRGGMVTKIAAAQTANRCGALTLIANGREPNILHRIYQGENLGTLFEAGDRLTSKKQWMAGHMRSNGVVTLDDGAIEVLQLSGKSLLPVGVIGVSGEFKRGELISCVDAAGTEVARGLSNYGASEVEMILGQSSAHIADILGYGGDDELIHRDNLVLL